MHAYSTHSTADHFNKSEKAACGFAEQVGQLQEQLEQDKKRIAELNATNDWYRRELAAKQKEQQQVYRVRDELAEQIRNMKDVNSTNATLRADNNKLRVELSSMKQTLDIAMSDFEILSAKYRKLDSTFDAQTSWAGRLQKFNFGLEERNQDLEASQKESARKIADLTSRVNKLQSELKDEDKALNRLEEEFTDLQYENQRLKKESHNSTAIQKLKSQIAEQERELKSADSDYQKLQTKHLQSISHNSKLSSQVSTLQAEIERLNDAMGSSNTLLDLLKAKRTIAQLEASLTKSQEKVKEYQHQVVQQQGK